MVIYTYRSNFAHSFLLLVPFRQQAYAQCPAQIYGQEKQNRHRARSHKKEFVSIILCTPAPGIPSFVLLSYHSQCIVTGGESRRIWVEWSCRFSPDTSAIRGRYSHRPSWKSRKRCVALPQLWLMLHINVSLASDNVKDAARAWIDKLSVKNGAYPPDSYPNPGEYICLILWFVYYTEYLTTPLMRE